MEFDSLDVEKDFPGLYASAGGDIKSKKNKDDSDYSDGEHDKVSKKDLLIGRRKDKKDKKDRGYATLGGESSHDEEIDAKSPSKSKKSLAFKFASSKSKEKREKSRDKSEKEGEDKVKERDKNDKEKDKKKDKERKDKDKKDKGSKKNKTQTCISSDEVLELGDVQPVFGVSVTLATERSRCHDGIELPLVVRDCIDYLQEHCLKSEQIYKVEPLKGRLQHFKRLYNNRESVNADTDDFDLATASSLLKLFLSDLPEPIVTSGLLARFEEVATHAQVTQQQDEFHDLLEQLPSCNKTLLGWLLLHFDAVIQHEKTNKINAQCLAMMMSPLLQMSHRLLIALLCHCNNLFADIQLIKYVPPLTPSSPKLPETVQEIQRELCKQESLLDQLHAEMNAGFVSKKREEQLWEVQRIITQLKRKLRMLSKVSLDDNSKLQQQQQPQQKKDNNDDDDDAAAAAAADVTDSLQVSFATTTTVKLPAMLVKQRKLSASDEENEVISEVPKNVPFGGGTSALEVQPVTPSSGQVNLAAEIYVDKSTGFLMLPKFHADYMTLLRLQLENQELINWKNELQSRITMERAEVLQLKQTYQQQEARLNNSNNNSNKSHCDNNDVEVLEEIDGPDYQRIVEQFVRENTLLEHKRNILAKEIFDEKRECIALQVELDMRKLCCNGN